MNHWIDLNADIGEGGDDAALVPLVSSASIACGFHAGDAETMVRSVALCKQHGVAIGAHPSFADRAGFGRREMPASADEIYRDVRTQLHSLIAVAHAHHARVQYLKPHGALYNMAARDRTLADAIARAVRDVDPRLCLIGLARSELVAAGDALGLRTWAEGFADRRYTATGMLVPRTQPRALITDIDEAAAQVLLMVREQRVIGEDGSSLPMPVDTVCIHGDSEHAVLLARHLREVLDSHHIGVRAGTRGETT